MFLILQDLEALRFKCVIKLLQESRLLVDLSVKLSHLFIAVSWHIWLAVLKRCLAHKLTV